MAQLKIVISIFLFTPVFLLAQTHMILKNIGSGADNGIPGDNQSTTWNGKAYFITISPDGFTNRIYSTDGTTTNTKQVLSNNYPSMHFLVSINDGLIFSASKDTYPGIYKSNGTQAGTSLLKNFPGREVVFMEALNEDKVIFITENFAGDTTSLWSTDGTANGTILLGNFDIKPDYIRFSFYEKNMILTEKSTNFDLFPPLITDGTIDGTMLVEDYINNAIPGSAFGISSAVGTEDFIFIKTVAGGKVFNGDDISAFSLSGEFIHGFKLGRRNVVFSDFDLMVYDSLTKTSVSIPIAPYYFSEPISYNGKVYYHDDFGHLVYETDGTIIGTKKIGSTPTGSFNYDPYLFANGDKLFYSANVGSNTELWVIDLNTDADSSFSKIQPASISYITPEVFSVGQFLVYARETTAEGSEYWVYDPMTTAVHDPNPIQPLTIIPNPAAEEIHFAFDGNLPASSMLLIYDATGKIVSEAKSILNEVSMDVSALSPGRYFVDVKNKSEVLFKGSFIKE